MKNKHSIIAIIIFLSLIILINNCTEVEDITKSSYTVRVRNKCCTSWKITEKGLFKARVDASSSSDTYKETSFVADEGKHNYIFSPEKDTCFYADDDCGVIIYPCARFYYSYESGEISFDIYSDMIINISYLGFVTISRDK